MQSAPWKHPSSHRHYAGWYPQYHRRHLPTEGMVIRRHRSRERIRKKSPGSSAFLMRSSLTRATCLLNCSRISLRSSLNCAFISSVPGTTTSSSSCGIARKEIYTQVRKCTFSTVFGGVLQFSGPQRIHFLAQVLRLPDCHRARNLRVLLQLRRTAFSTTTPLLQKKSEFLVQDRVGDGPATRYAISLTSSSESASFTHNSKSSCHSKVLS